MYNNTKMKEEYREKLVSVSLSETSEPPLQQSSYMWSSCCYSWSCKKSLHCIVKTIRRMFFTRKQRENLETSRK